MLHKSCGGFKNVVCGGYLDFEDWVVSCNGGWKSKVTSGAILDALYKQVIFSPNTWLLQSANVLLFLSRIVLEVFLFIPAFLVWAILLLAMYTHGVREMFCELARADATHLAHAAWGCTFTGLVVFFVLRIFLFTFFGYSSGLRNVVEDTFLSLVAERILGRRVSGSAIHDVCVFPGSILREVQSSQNPQ